MLPESIGRISLPFRQYYPSNDIIRLESDYPVFGSPATQAPRNTYLISLFYMVLKTTLLYVLAGNGGTKHGLQVKILTHREHWSK